MGLFVSPVACAMSFCSTGEGTPMSAFWIWLAIDSLPMRSRIPNTVSGRLITTEIQLGIPA